LPSKLAPITGYDSNRQAKAPASIVAAMPSARAFALITLLAALLPGFARPLEARVERVEILERGPLAGGRVFGPVGAYERIKGRLHYAVDPENPANARIVDLALAPRDARGLVTFAGDFFLIRPKDLGRGNHRLLYEVDNRGNLGMLAFFDDAPWSNDPKTAADLGNGFLLRQGYSLLWSAWNWDVLPGDGRLQIELPVPTANGAPITGPVAAEFVLMRPTQSAAFMWGNSRGYLPVDVDEPAARLTVRDTPTGARKPIPRDQWRFADPTRVSYDAGFVPGRIYEVVYTARDPRVVGLGLAAIRDSISFFRFEAADASGRPNPLASHGVPDAQAALAFGISQSARVLQHMLLEALHVDEAGRMVFDGALIHVAGGGKGSFNHRFAQTTRHPSELEDQQYPADFFPFATTPEVDPVTGARGDLLARARAAGALPKLVYTMTSTEYWTRSASLLHTDVEGARDLPFAPNARLYLFASAQHGNWRAAGRGPYQNCGNPLDHRPPMRALLLALDAWTTRGTAPPASIFPTLADGTLGSVAVYRSAFPAIPGLPLPSRNLQPPRLDLGPRFATRGIADKQPPGFGPPFITRVPLPDADGNDRGGIRLPEVAVPLGTYTGWNLRLPEVGAPDHLARWSGSFFPFPRTEAERRAAGDPRPALETRYRSRADYQAKIGAAAAALVEKGFLLEADVATIATRAGALYNRLLRHRPDDPSCAYELDN
jgi:Alpha/beta hydrolase domain